MFRGNPTLFVMHRPCAPGSGRCYLLAPTFGASARTAMVVIVALLASTLAIAATDAGAILGLPFTRFYSLEEIGNVSLGRA